MDFEGEMNRGDSSVGYWFGNARDEEEAENLLNLDTINNTREIAVAENLLNSPNSPNIFGDTFNENHIESTIDDVMLGSQHDLSARIPIIDCVRVNNKISDTPHDDSLMISHEASTSFQVEPTNTHDDPENSPTSSSESFDIDEELQSDEELPDSDEYDQVYLSSEEEDFTLNLSQTDDGISDNVENPYIETNPLSSRGQGRTYYGQQKPTRKRKRDTNNWRRNITKAAKNRGQQYVSSTTKKVVPARAMQRSCGPGCKFRCDNKLDHEERSANFEGFWEIRQHARKYDRILHCVSEHEKTQNPDQVSRRKYSRKYHLFNRKNEKVRVCQTMFLRTLGISIRIVETALSKQRSGIAELKDLRGTSAKRPRTVDESVRESVLKHINMFQRVESHYCRQNSQREYLEQGLTLSRMYRLYLEWAKTEGLQPATKHYYSDIFNSEFNLGFFRPKKDVCDLCQSRDNTPDDNKALLEKKYRIHQENKKLAREEKERDFDRAKKDNGKKISMICFDFQKILNCPVTDSSCLYYKRKLNVYHLTIYDCVTHKAHCYCWTENDAKRGSNETASCLLHYIGIRSAEGIEEFLLWSDNCAGQNRNKNVFAMFEYASQKYNVNIKHTFLEVGHTQNQGDSVHARVECHARNRKIYTPEQWYEIIRDAKVTEPKYEVIRVTYDMVYDFDELAKNQNWSKRELKTSKKGKMKLANAAVGISESKQVIVTKDKPNFLLYKKSFGSNGEGLATRKEKKHADVKKYVLKKAYEGVQGLSKDKIKDLNFLCDSNVVRPEYHSYFKSLPEKYEQPVSQ